MTSGMFPGEIARLLRDVERIAGSLHTLTKSAPAIQAALETIAANLLTARAPAPPSSDIGILLEELADYLANDGDPKLGVLYALGRVAPDLHARHNFADWATEREDDHNSVPYQGAATDALPDRAVFDIALAQMALGNDTPDMWGRRDPLVLPAHVREAYPGVCWNCKHPVGHWHAPSCVNGPLFPLPAEPGS